MPEYDVRQLDSNAEIIGSRKLSFETDGEAISVGYGTVYAAPRNCHAVEVWGEGRMVARLTVPPGSNCLVGA